MATKFLRGPIVLRAASLALAAANAFTDIKGAAGEGANTTSGAIKLGALSLAVVRFLYTRGAAGGNPIVRMYGSLDSDETAAADVSNWQPVLIMDSSTLTTAGQVDLYPEAQSILPSPATATVMGAHPVNVSAFNWLLVQIADSNATPGAVANVVLGGST